MRLCVLRFANKGHNKTCCFARYLCFNITSIKSFKRSDTICFNHFIMVQPSNVFKQEKVRLKKTPNITVKKRSFVYPGSNCKGKVSWFQCCVALLCFMVAGVNGQFSYSEVKSGTCGSVSGRVGITDKATCETAAGNLGLSGTTLRVFHRRKKLKKIM